MANTQIRITRNDEMNQALALIKEQYPLLNEAELAKVAISFCYKHLKQQKIRRWEASLPTIELNSEEAALVTIGIKEADAGLATTTTVEDIMEQINSDE